MDARTDETGVDAVGDLARHAAQVRFEDLPAPVVEKAKTFLLDTIGVGIAGSSGANVDTLKRVAASWGAGDEATVWLTGERMTAQAAAIVNAYQIHCLEYDCVHEEAVVHPMATVLSALMAGVEARSAAGTPVPGKDFLAALAVGVDVAAMLGMAGTGQMNFFRPATCGGFGATAALSSIHRFDEARIRDAFGILYGATSGTMQPHVEGSPVLGLQIGFNSRSALTAVSLAAAGFPGPHDVLTGRYGYFRLFEAGAFDIDWIWECLGRKWRIAELSHKPFPSGRLTHGVVDALMQLTDDHGVSPDDIAHIKAIVPPLVHRLVGRPDIPSPETNYAKLCLPFVAGVFLARGHVDVPDFIGKANLEDPAVHAHAAKVEVVLDGNPDPNTLDPQTFVFTLRDGRKREIVLDRVYGHPDAPLDREANVDKFMRCTSYAARPLAEEHARRIVAAVDGIEDAPDAAALARLTVAP